MRCNLDNRNQIIENYLGGRLTEAEKEAFDEHCFNCDVCYQELRLREEMIETIKSDGATIFSARIAAHSRRPTDEKKSLLRKFFPSRLRRPAFAFAGLVLLVTVSALLLKQQWRQTTGGLTQGSAPMMAEEQRSAPEKAGEKSQQPAHAQKPAAQTKPAKNEQLYAANFQPSPMFEEMLSSNLRASSMEIVTPQPGQKVESGRIRFEWRGTEPGPFYVKILNNRGREVAAVKTVQRRVQITQKLPPGLYYWKLETEEDLLHLGKFLVPVPDNR